MVRWFDFTMTGTTPILFHHDNIEWQDGEREKATKKVRGGAGDDRNVVGKWAAALYLSEGRVVYPSDNIDAMLKAAGAQLKNGRASLKKAVEAGVICESDPCKFEACSEGKWGVVNVPDADFEKCAFDYDGPITLFVKRVKVQGSRHIRVRPRFDKWRVTGRLQVTNDAITEGHVEQLFDIGGKSVGLGDWRPRFGQFEGKVARVKK